MGSKLPDELVEPNLSPYGTSTFGADDKLPEASEEERFKLESGRGYSPDPPTS